MKRLYFLASVLIPIIVFALDRLTKYKALSLSAPVYINKFLYFDLCFNRGISWGLFSSSSTLIFTFVTIATIFITGILSAYAYVQYKNNINILPALLVLSGSISNIIDRFYYRGVIDFIVVHIGDYNWPTFNIADASIVIGAILMAYYLQD